MERIEVTYKIHIEKQKVEVWLFIVALTLPHMNPGYISQVPVLETVINGWRLASFAVIVVWLFITRKRIVPPVILIIIQQIYIFLVTIVNNGEIYNCMASMFSMFSVILLYIVALDDKDRNTFISAQLFCFEIVIYINLLTVLIYPDTMYVTHNSLVALGHNWFLGYYNNYTQFFVPALMFAWLYKLHMGKKVRAYSLAIAIFVTAFLVWSGGVLVSLFGMMTIYLFFKNRTAIFNCYTYWCMHIVFLIAIPILMTQNWFHWLLYDVLGKGESFLVRISLWRRVLTLIYENPVFGHGIKNAVTRETEVRVDWAIHAHNMVLEILYQGGIINFILWLAIVIVSGKIIWKYKDTLESKIIATAWAGWCIATLVEPFTTPFLMGMFIVAYYSNADCRDAEVAIPQRETLQKENRQRKRIRVRLR